jgi:methionine salvage enolase-phosphatase E1
MFDKVNGVSGQIESLASDINIVKDMMQGAYFPHSGSIPCLSGSDLITGDRRRKVLRWICNIDHERDHCSAKEKRVAMTGKWILTDRKYLQWKQSLGKLFWLYGDGTSSPSCVFLTE